MGGHRIYSTNDIVPTSVWQGKFETAQRNTHSFIDYVEYSYLMYLDEK